MAYFRVQKDPIDKYRQWIVMGPNIITWTETWEEAIKQALRLSKEFFRS